MSSSPASSPHYDSAFHQQHQHITKGSVKSHSEPHLLSDKSESKGSKRERPNKHKFGQILSRSKSVHREESPMSKQPMSEDDLAQNPMPADYNLKTAPLEMKPQDTRFRDMIRTSKRNRSAERAGTRSVGTHENARTPSKERRNPIQDPSKDQPGHFFQNIRNSKSKASDISKAGKGFFGKLTRSGSSHDRDGAESQQDWNPDHYTPTIIRMGIVDQTRETRISKRLEMSRDKTEFWLPALPWRCIDYLNLKGTEVEGLYRVSGSVRELKYWQMRFDTGKPESSRYVHAANDQQSAMSTCLARKIYTTSMLSHRC